MFSKFEGFHSHSTKSLKDFNVAYLTSVLFVIPLNIEVPLFVTVWNQINCNVNYLVSSRFNYELMVRFNIFLWLRLIESRMFPILGRCCTYPFSFITVFILLWCFHSADKWRLSNLTEDSWISRRTVAGDGPSILLHTLSSMQTGGTDTRTRIILAIFPRETRWAQASGPWHLILCGTVYSLCY